MRIWSKCVIITLLAGLMLIVQPCEGNSLEPTFFIDFDNVIPAAASEFNISTQNGIAGTDCLDLRGSTTPIPVFNDQALLDALGEVSSLTITGWYKSKVDFKDVNNGYILSCPPGISLFIYGHNKGKLCLDLQSEPDDNGKFWSSWFSTFFADDAWTFFAITYDADKDTEKTAFYVGSEEEPVVLDHVTTYDVGKLSKAGIKELIIGASDKDGTGRFNGLLDSIRIYASKNDNSAALSKPQIEAIIDADLGKDWLKRAAAKKETAAQAKQQQIKEKYWNEDFNANLVDSLDSIFPDIAPVPQSNPQPIAVPRQSKVSFQIAMMSQKDSLCEIAVSTLLESKVTIYKLLSVPVEANNNGGIRTSITTVPPATWYKYYIRKAPFEVYDVLVESDTVELKQGIFQPILIEVDIPKDAAPGQYKGSVKLTAEDTGVSAEVPFEFVVYKTIAPEKPILNSTHWLSIKPVDLTTEDIPDWWSQRHWDMIARAGRILAEYGQNTVFTPLVDGSQPLIQTTIKKDGTYRFDYSRFDRWFELFLKLGFVNFDGHQIAGGHNVRPMDVYAFDESTGNKIKMFSRNDESAVEAWFEFIPDFYKSLYAHLKEKGWVKNYSQCQLDEPKDKASYERLVKLAREHMPGIRTKDAINRDIAYYSPLIDVHVFGVVTLPANKQIAKERMQQGKETWLYHCASPYPPFPNRHLDEALTSSRLYPWYAYQLKATGYLYWAANYYRGADPYKTSVGPLPNGSQSPGHPPGDNWFFYRGPQGLRGSMRMTAFREGLLDHTLLMMLAEKAPDKAEKIMDSLARSLIDFERSPEPYHKARKLLLEALDGM